MDRAHQEAPRSQRGESIASIKIGECGGSRAALARALRALAGRLELERFVSFSSVFVRSFLARSRGRLRKHAARARRAFGAGTFREFLVRFFQSFLARSRGRLRKHASRSASL